MQASILLDARKLGDGGIGVYIENLVEGLLALKRQGRANLKLSLLVSPRHLGGSAKSPLKRWAEEVAFYAEPSGKYSFSEYFMLAGRQRHVLRDTDLFHSPHYTLPFFVGTPSVVTIHDIIHVLRPESVLHRVFAPRLIRSSIKRAARIVSVSEASGRLLRSSFPSVAGKLRVIPNSIPEGFRVMSEGESDLLLPELLRQKKYCLFVGNDRSHKGFSEILEAWAMLKAGNSGVPMLAVVGERFGEGVKSKVRELALEPEVLFLGALSREQLCGLYNGAESVLLPSRAEGFGLPALEGLACGTPVVCTPLPCFREVCGDSAWYSDGFSAEALAEVVCEMLGDAFGREKKVRSGLKQAERFRGVESAEKICMVYEQVLGEQRSSAGLTRAAGLDPILCDSPAAASAMNSSSEMEAGGA